MSKIEIGKKAPSFTLEGTGGTWALDDGKGAAVVIYFYPRDNTSGCTQEGLDFAALNARRTVWLRTKNSRKRWPFPLNC